MSSGSAKHCPAMAVRRKIRHQASCRLSQQAPTGMKAWRMRGWPVSQSRVALLLWLDRLSVITTRSIAEASVKLGDSHLQRCVLAELVLARGDRDDEGENVGEDA